jgi:hypothetical protein
MKSSSFRPENVNSIGWDLLDGSFRWTPDQTQILPCPILTTCRGPHGQVFVRGVVGREGWETITADHATDRFTFRGSATTVFD